MHSIRLALAVVTLAVPLTAAHAQRGSHAHPAPAAPVGFMLNAHSYTTPGFGIKGNDVAGEISTSMGPGVGARIGYGITPRYMVFAGADIARLGAGNGLDGNWGFALMELGGRMSFPSARSVLTPYITASVGWRAIAAEVEDAGDVSFDGLTLGAGGGLQYQLSSTVALDGNLSFGYGKFGGYEDPLQTADLDVDNTLVTQLRLGVNWYP